MTVGQLSALLVDYNENSEVFVQLPDASRHEVGVDIDPGNVNRHPITGLPPVILYANH